MTSKEGRRFFILAGESSGDQHGAALMSAMQSGAPGVSFTGIGGEEMRAAGLVPLYDARQMAVVGFSEVFRKIPFLRRAMRAVVDHILDARPERAILIDYPGFNLRLAKRLHRSGIPVTYYISPQLWAWREGRIEAIKRYVDQMLVIFPFEEPWYRERGVEALFVGHPILEEPPPALDREAFLASHGLDSERPVLTLYPGSRPEEIKRHLELFHETAALVKNGHPSLQIMLGLAKDLSTALVSPDIAASVTLAHDSPRLALRYADAAIVASGTATLEAAVWGVPQAVVYRMSAFSAWLGRKLAKVSHFSMVNILAGREIVPEFLQERAQAGPIARSIVQVLGEGDVRQRMLGAMDVVRHSLEPPHGSGASAMDASSRASQLILEATVGK